MQYLCVYPKLKIFQKNGKRSTQEEADEVSQVRQEDNEEDHQEYSGPERPLRIEYSPLKPVTYCRLVFALLCRFRAVLGPFLMFVYIKYIV